MTETAERLKTWRERYGISQRQLCIYLGISPMTYSRYERGLARPSAETVERIRAFYEARAAQAEHFVNRLTDKQRAALFCILDLVENGGGVLFKGHAPRVKGRRAA